VIELPEAFVLASQINSALKGKTIRRAIANAHPHSFAVYNGDPALYNDMLAGKTILGSVPCGGNMGGCHVEIDCGGMLMIISTPIRYHSSKEKTAAKHQLLVEFNDMSSISCTVQMWGSLLCVPDARAESFMEAENHKLPTPLDDAFNQIYFSEMIKNSKPSLSVKAFLTAEQRIPGLGNGVMHDILFNARIHPKRKIDSFTEYNEERLFYSIKNTLRYMAERGGRDTEKDLFGNWGGYKTILSNKTSGLPCRTCNGPISKEAFLGGNVYYCSECQPMK
jgi:formamidopyrimidine-DNA glycosylase